MIINFLYDIHKDIEKTIDRVLREIGSGIPPNLSTMRKDVSTIVGKFQVYYDMEQHGLDEKVQKIGTIEADNVLKSAREDMKEFYKTLNEYTRKWAAIPDIKENQERFLRDTTTMLQSIKEQLDSQEKQFHSYLRDAS